MKTLILFFGGMALVGIMSLVPSIDFQQDQGPMQIEFVGDFKKILPPVSKPTKAQKIKALRKKKAQPSEDFGQHNEGARPKLQVYIREVEYGRKNASLSRSKALSPQDQAVLDMMDQGQMARSEDSNENWADEDQNLNSELADEFSDIE